VNLSSISAPRLLGLALWLVAGAALAQGYPAKPVHIVVPFGPGGAVDTVSRIVGQRLSEQLKQPFVIENRAGASGNLGAEAVAKAAPDGYTLLMGANGLATNGALFGKLPFDTLRDFAPVARIGYAPLVLVVPASSQAKSLRELVALARAQPGKLNYGTAGNGSSGHLASELLRTTAGIDVFHVPYKGGAPALTDLVGERLSFMLINPVEAVPHVKAQRLRALAVSSDKRLALLADVPTFAEAGLPGYEASVWWGLVAPARTPPDLVRRLSDETLRALEDAGVREKLEAQGAVVAPQASDRFGRFLAQEIRTWEAVIRKSGIRAD
jgi:tripartite-type tricarboxylate transporter receptor subunit TctC